MDTKVCNRCKTLGRPSEHPLSSYYMKGGKPLPTCKVCRRELAAAHHKRVRREEQAAQRDALTGSRVFPADAVARTVVTQTSPNAPQIAIWRCMSCFKKTITRGKSREIPPPFPVQWRNLTLRLHDREEPVVLCGPCSTALLRARKILARVAERIEQEEKAMNQVH